MNIAERVRREGVIPNWPSPPMDITEKHLVLNSIKSCLTNSEWKNFLRVRKGQTISKKEKIWIEKKLSVFFSTNVSL